MFQNYKQFAKGETLCRIIRFTKFPDNTITTLDRAKNILLVDREAYDLLPEYEQRELLRTNHEKIIWNGKIIPA